MPVVAAVDSSRPIWPSCPAAGWVSGVDRLSARPNGKKLLTGSGGANQSIGEGRPAGYPFPKEGHGPYTAFMGEFNGYSAPLTVPLPAFSLCEPSLC